MNLEQKRDEFFSSKASPIKPAPKVSIQAVNNETLTPTQPAINALLNNVEAVDIREACEQLGWSGKKDDYPKQKHIKVAIIGNLINISKRYNWHIIRDAGYFYIYNGAYWIPLVDDQVKQMLKDAAIKMAYTEIECRDALFVDKLFQQATQDGFFTERNVTKQSVINLKNGSLVLSESGMALKPFDYRDFLTHQLDFSYKEGATNPLFLKYLTEVLPDEDTRKTLQQIAGYLFVKGLKLEKVFFLFGEGSNGKSVFFEVLNGILGNENISNYSLESLTDEKGYHRAMIKNKVVNYGTDIRLTKIDAGIFKTLASGEPIEARLPYKEPFMMTDYAKLIFNVNKIDSANIEHTHGFYRRLLVIPFNKTITEDQADRDLHTKILSNRAGVLNWIIDGAEAVVKNRKIFISKECDDFKQKFIKETDSVAMYEADFLETINGDTYYKGLTIAYQDYQIYCKDAGVRYPLGRNNFVNRMIGLGFEKFKSEQAMILRKKYIFEKGCK